MSIVLAIDKLIAFWILKKNDFKIHRQIRGSEETGAMEVKYPELNMVDVKYLYLFARSVDGKI